MTKVDPLKVEPRLFTLIRHIDETGISGVGRVLDGVIFHTGQVVICWRSDLNQAQTTYSSIAVYPSWEAFIHIHIKPHPEDAVSVIFAHIAMNTFEASSHETPDGGRDAGFVSED